MKFLFSFILLFSGSTVFAQKQAADLIIHNATIYTVNSRFDIAEAFAIKDDRILAIGLSEEILKKFQAKYTLDAMGKTILPGLIDAHTHFYRYGEALQTVDLVGTKSWEEALQKCAVFAKQNTEGWLIGRGWDQNDWAVKEYPTKEQLDKLFPKRPVFLTRVDGHAALANQVAVDLAKIQAGQTLTGGEIETKNGQLTGVLIDNAMRLVRDLIPEANDKQRRQAFLDAQKNCFAVGLTTVVDCGVNAPLIDFIEKMNLDKSLKMRLNLMLSDDRDN